MSKSDAIIIGAGPAGLACAACLKQMQVEAILLEKADGVGAVWRRHYDRLHLHTDRGHSALPGLAMPKTYPRYPSRAQVVDYLEAYAGAFGLRPRLRCEVTRARRVGDVWQVETATDTFEAANLIVATGLADWPYRPNWPGEDRFGGGIRHSSAYRNAAPYAGQNVLVVGYGNSGGEIALDLAENGVSVAISVRGPVNIVPRDLFGIPILSVAFLLRALPPSVADVMSAPLVWLRIGSLKRLGLAHAKAGPLTEIAKRGRVPVLDIGTVARIREGRIGIRPDLRSLDERRVEFVDGRREAYDAIIAATGFRPDLRQLLPDVVETLDGAGLPVASGRPTAAAGLYFCGFRVAATGQFAEIGVEARRIAWHVSQRMLRAANIDTSYTRKNCGLRHPSS